MRSSDITCYADMETYIKLEIARQTQTKRTVELELPERFFFKLLKLIQFYLKDEPKEREAKKVFDDSIKTYWVRINRIQTEVIRK